MISDIEREVFSSVFSAIAKNYAFISSDTELSLVISSIIKSLSF